MTPQAHFFVSLRHMREQQSSAVEHAWPAAEQLFCVGATPGFAPGLAEAETAKPRAKLAATATRTLFMVVLLEARE